MPAAHVTDELKYTPQHLEQYLKEKCNYSAVELDEILYRLLDQGRDLYYKEALEAEVIQTETTLDKFKLWVEDRLEEEDIEILNEVMD